VGHGGIAVHIPIVGTKWSTVRFTPRSLYHCRKSPRYPLNRRLRVSYRESGLFQNRTNPLQVTETEPCIVKPKAWSLKGYLKIFPLTFLELVGIVTSYGLDDPGMEFRWGRQFCAPVQNGRGSHSASYTLGTGSLSGVKRPWRGVTIHPIQLRS
jgi:hypothetical protein